MRIVRLLSVWEKQLKMPEDTKRQYWQGQTFETPFGLSWQRQPAVFLIEMRQFQALVPNLSYFHCQWWCLRCIFIRCLPAHFPPMNFGVRWNHRLFLWQLLHATCLVVNSVQAGFLSRNHLHYAECSVASRFCHSRQNLLQSGFYSTPKFQTPFLAMLLLPPTGGVSCTGCILGHEIVPLSVAKRMSLGNFPVAVTLNSVIVTSIALLLFRRMESYDVSWPWWFEVMKKFHRGFDGEATNGLALLCSGFGGAVLMAEPLRGWLTFKEPWPEASLWAGVRDFPLHPQASVSSNMISWTRLYGLWL